MSAITDVAQAWVQLWNATTSLTAAVPGGLYADQVSQAQALKADTPRPLPYAILTVGQARPPRFGHRFWTDYRSVRLELYGNNGKVDIGNLVSLVHSIFDYPARLNVNAFNANAWHAWTEHGAEEAEGPSATKRHGQYQRLASVEWLVATERTRN